MSAENELYIYLRMEAAQAEATSRAYHSGERQRIHQTAVADAQAAKEQNAARRKALDESVQMARAAQKDFQDIAKRALKDEQDAQKAKAKAAKETADQLRQTAREQAAQANQAARERAASEKQAAKEATQQQRMASKEVQQLIKEQAATEARTLKETNTARRKAVNEAVAMARAEQADLEAIAKAELQATQDAARAKASITKDFARADQRAQDELNAAFRKAKQDEVRETQQALRKQTADKKQAFREWKQEHDNAHKVAMMQWEQQQEAIKETERATFSSAAALGAYVTGFASLGTAKAVLSTIVSQLNSAADFTKETAKNFIELRKSMQQVAALKDKSNDAKFTLEEVEKAKAASLTPDEWRNFQEEFQSFAGAQLEGPDRKLDDKQAEEFQQRVSKFIKSEGIAPQLGAELGGTLLENSKGPQNVDNLMDRYGKTYETLKKSRTPVAQLLPQVARVAAYGVSPEEAAQLLAVIAPAMPREEDTGVENTFRAIQELKSPGKDGEPSKAEEFGIKKGMTKFEEVKALSRNVAERMKKGEDPAEFLKAAKVGDMRQLRGIQGLARYGVELGGFARFERYAKDLPVNHTNQAAKRFDASENGQQAARDADRAAALAKSGADNRKLEELRQEAETQLIKEKRFEKPTAGDFGRGTLANFTGVPVKEQLINERSVSIARQRSHYNPMATKGVDPRASVTGHENTAVVNEGLRILLERQIKLQEEANVIAKQIAAKKPAPGPQVAVPIPGRPHVMNR